MPTVIVVTIAASVFAFFARIALEILEHKAKNVSIECMKRNVEKTYMIDAVTHERISGSSAFARGMIGGALGGDLGMIAGAASAKTKSSTTYTFLVINKDGTREIKDCVKGSREWDFLISKLSVD